MNIFKTHTGQHLRNISSSIYCSFYNCVLAYTICNLYHCNCYMSIYPSFHKDGIEILARGQPITDSNGVGEVIKKFKSKYGEGEFKKYYTKLDVAVEVPL